jgi:hypothetical protein
LPCSVDADVAEGSSNRHHAQRCIRAGRGRGGSHNTTYHPPASTLARGGVWLPHHSPEGNGRTGGVHVALVSSLLPEEVGGRGAGQRSHGRTMVPGQAVYRLCSRFCITVHTPAEHPSGGGASAFLASPLSLPTSGMGYHRYARLRSSFHGVEKNSWNTELRS